MLTFAPNNSFEYPENSVLGKFTDISPKAASWTNSPGFPLYTIEISFLSSCVSSKSTFNSNLSPTFPFIFICNSCSMENEDELALLPDSSLSYKVPL